MSALEHDGRYWSCPEHGWTLALSHDKPGWWCVHCDARQPLPEPAPQGELFPQL